MEDEDDFYGPMDEFFYSDEEPFEGFVDDGFGF